ncbi:hypothetical protein K432DRAFT_236491 [Lepidopterella palustris CBS 459.81]|uniref:Peptidase S8/S53 domain-containing protein n=1 Tax=Lepidopterella palustris CBS 459.81 TaxID=1314670 RepID=A0A8E2DXM7_9PEZI|nr:hypothetical protein K432DRAFT_236491 [Lepidopterella palustris CBS 459.81]
MDTLESAVNDFSSVMNDLPTEFPTEFSHDLESLKDKFTGTPDLANILKGSHVQSRALSNSIGGLRNLINDLKPGSSLSGKIPKEELKNLVKDALDSSVAKPKSAISLNSDIIKEFSELEPKDNTPDSSNSPTSDHAGSTGTSQAKTSVQASAPTSISTSQSATSSQGRTSTPSTSIVESTKNESATSMSTSQSTRTTTSSTTSSSSSSQSASATPQFYVILTKQGTPYDDFLNFTNNLDGGVGIGSKLDTLDWQYYATTMTADKAKELTDTSLYPFIELVVLDKPVRRHNQLNGVITTGESRRTRPKRQTTDRQWPQNTNLFERTVDPATEDTPVASQYNLKNLQVLSRSLTNEAPNYIFDPLLGKGTTIYILDSGYNENHKEFLSTPTGRRQNPVRSYVVPNSLTLQTFKTIPKAPEDMTDYGGEWNQLLKFYKGHGTCVGSHERLPIRPKEG